MHSFTVTPPPHPHPPNHLYHRVEKNKRKKETPSGKSISKTNLGDVKKAEEGTSKEMLMKKNRGRKVKN